MTWYYEQAGEQRGPVSDSDLENLFKAGTIQPETLVWREGMANWAPYSQVKNVSGATPRLAVPPGPGDVVCVECGKMFPADEVVKFGSASVCATCKPIYVQKLREGAALSGVTEYGGFWIRFCAKFIDNVILMLPLIVLAIGLVFYFAPGRKATSAANTSPFALSATGNSEAVGAVVQLVVQAGFMFVSVLYQTFFLGRYGATPGKMACKLIVVTADGQKIGYGRACGRACAEILSGVLCYIGYIMAAFDKEKRALHDHICGTRVVKKVQ